MDRVGDYEYNAKDLIGHGAFAVVYRGRHRKNHNLIVAIKSITKKNLSKSQNLLGKEIKILKELTELHHENVVALMDCKETPHNVFLVMEYCNGGDLADYLHAKGTLSEDTIRLFLRQLAGAMRALNAKGIVHRDLKPQNILLCHSVGKASPAPHEIKLKIADFGFARFLQDGVMAATLCGSPMYMAPEVIMSLQYDAKADLWSIGTIVFQCLTGKAPFQAQTPQALKQFYEKNVNLTPKISSGTSAELADLLVRLLKRNAKDRLEFDEFFSHPFLKKVARPTSPVPVPTRQHSIPREVTPVVKTISNSPASTEGCRYSPPDVCEDELPGEVMASATLGSSPYEQARFGTPDANKAQGSPSSTEEPDGFVMVPTNLPSDSSAENVGLGVLKRKSAEIFGSSPMLVGTPPKMSSSPSAGLLHHPKRYSSPLEPPSPRPSYLPVTNSPGPVGGGLSGVPPQPIPVPSQKMAYEQIQQSLQGSPIPGSPVSSQGATGSSSNSPPRSPKSQWDNCPALNANASVPRSQPIVMRQNSQDSAGRMTPDLASLSPPSVQFMIGTPPMIGRRTSSSSGNTNTPPPSAPWPCITSPYLQGRHIPNSPLRKSSVFSSPPNSNYFFGANCGSNLAALTDNPANTMRYPPSSAPPGFTCNPFPTNLVPPDVNNGVTSPSQPLVVPFGTRDSAAGVSVMETSAGSAFLQRSGSTGRLNDAFNGFRAVFTNPQGSGDYRNSVMPYGRHSSGFLFDREVLCSSAGRPHFGSSRDATSPSGAAASRQFQFSTSPTLLDGPVYFVAPELAEETIMEREHNEILAKLNFVATLVDCIIDLAKTRSTPFVALTESAMRRETRDRNNPAEQQVPVISDSCRRAEQLVLYYKALQMLSASLNLSREELKTGRLQPSSCVKSVVTNMNKKYHHCLQMCKSLNSQNLLQATRNDPRAAAITADKLLYNYAIEMCQSAALEELFGEPQECFRRYQTAQILLHSLAQQINNENDRYCLNKYKDAVEKRLYILQQQGFVYAYDTSVT